MVDNKLFYGDNLDVMRSMDSGSIDLVYLDPPFNSKRDYNVIFSRHAAPKSDASAQIQAFSDTWSWTPDVAAEYDRCVNGGVPNAVADALTSFRKMLGENDALAYLVMMAPRMVQIHRVLKPTGSVYLHCDPVMSHYLKALLDTIFGFANFQNEIIWHHGLGAMAGMKKYPSKHDVIFFYSKTADFTFNKQRGEVTEAMAKKYSHEDEHGKYMNSYGKKYYLKGGKPLDDVWEIAALSPTSKERLGYPTQKPLALLERILLASSNEGDVVLDPFCGCGTTVDAAQKLNRSWVGIDITYIAVDLIQKRLIHTYGPTVVKSFELSGVPRDVASAQALFQRNPFDFERWAVSRVGAQPNQKSQIGDRGIDGVARFPLGFGEFGRVLVSVKGGKTVNPAMARELAGTVHREKAELGVLITQETPSKGVIDELNHGGSYVHPPTGQTYPKLQSITVADLLSSKKPNLPPTVLPYIAAEAQKRDVAQEELDFGDEA